MRKKEKLCRVHSGVEVRKKAGRHAFLLLAFAIINGVNAQSNFPEEDFWSLDAGIGMSNILVYGESFQLVVDPKLWLSPKHMVGSKVGVNFSTDRILTFEGQVYVRWNFLHLDFPKTKSSGLDSPRAETTNLFVQGGLGMLASYRGNNNPFDNVKRTRGSLLFDLAAGATIPLTPRWHIEPSIRGGYPHIFGFSITAGYKFPLPEKTKNEQLPGKTEYVEVTKTEYVEVTKTEYVEIIKTIPPKEIFQRTVISAVEYVLFGPDIGQYNVGIDHDAESLNELVLNEMSLILNENPDIHVRIEGHANPVTVDPKEAEELQNLSTTRANQVAEQLRGKGVAEDQMVVIAFGGTRTVTNDHDIWNRNRRVELIMIQLDPSARF